jgi:tRNA pseudouridine55 synthase
MRAIAHEMGQALGCGAHLLSLRRTASSEFEIAQARTIAQLEQWAAEDRFIEALVPARELLASIPTEVVDAPTAAFIRQGRPFRVSPFRQGSVTEARLIKAVDQNGELIAIGEVRLPNLYHPILVL